MIDGELFIRDTYAILQNIRYGDWIFFVARNADGTPYLQLVWKDVCNDTGESCELKSRKWMLSEHMTKSEIIQTAFKAVLVAEEHEIREKFTYKNEPIFGPHFDLEVMVELSRAGKTDERH